MLDQQIIDIASRFCIKQHKEVARGLGKIVPSLFDFGYVADLMQHFLHVLPSQHNLFVDADCAVAFIRDLVVLLQHLPQKVVTVVLLLQLRRVELLQFFENALWSEFIVGGANKPDQQFSLVDVFFCEIGLIEQVIKFQVVFIACVIFIIEYFCAVKFQSLWKIHYLVGIFGLKRNPVTTNSRSSPPTITTTTTTTTSTPISKSAWSLKRKSASSNPKMPTK